MLYPGLLHHVAFSYRFQELDLSPEALLFQDSSREKPWLTAVDEGLPGGADYTKVFLHLHSY